MTDHGRPVGPQGGQHRDEILGVVANPVRARQPVRTAAAPEVGCHNSHAGKLFGQEHPRQVVGGDAVQGEHGGRYGGALVGRFPHAHAQEAAGDLDVSTVVGVSAHPASHPPSRTYEEPVAIEASGPVSQPTREATSEGSMRRLTDCLATSTFSVTSASVMPWTRAWSAIWRSTKGVLTYPGFTHTLVTPYSAPSRAVTLLNPSRHAWR